jgi:thiosulfate reductase cytochrome b subunit
MTAADWIILSAVLFLASGTAVSVWRKWTLPAALLAWLICAITGAYPFLRPIIDANF